MDGYTTSSRRTPGSAIPSVTKAQYFRNGPLDVVKTADRLSGFNLVQTTTSFRTGDASDTAAPTSLEDVVDGVESYSDLFSRLKEDKRQNDIPSGADRGHEFDTVKRTMKLSHPHVVLNYTGAGGGFPLATYEGPLVFYPTSHVGDYFASAPDLDVGYYGPTAIARARPAQSQMDLAVSLAELYREGFPHGYTDLETLKAQTTAARASSGKYLEYQFGWTPLISDVRKAAHILRNYRALLEQFHRDAGKPIRRKVFFPAVVSSDAWTGNYTLNTGVDVPPTSYSDMMIGGEYAGPGTETIRTQQSVWFSGAFSYVNSGVNHGFLNRLRGLDEDFQYLIGHRITPEVLWNLAPWSWLADWKANIGDNISNASHLGSDGLVMRYGYLMCETITDHTYVLTGPRYKNGISGPYTMTFTTVRKQRVKATPFGFGLSPSGFNLKQWSILGALGISKGPQSLW